MDMLVEFENTDGAKVFVVANNVTHLIPTAAPDGPATICFVSGEFIKVRQTCDQVAAALGMVFGHRIIGSDAA